MIVNDSRSINAKIQEQVLKLEGKINDDDVLDEKDQPLTLEEIFDYYGHEGNRGIIEDLDYEERTDYRILSALGGSVFTKQELEHHFGKKIAKEIPSGWLSTPSKIKSGKRETTVDLVAHSLREEFPHLEEDQLAFSLCFIHLRDLFCLCHWWRGLHHIC